MWDGEEKRKVRWTGSKKEIGMRGIDSGVWYTSEGTGGWGRGARYVVLSRGDEGIEYRGQKRETMADEQFR